VTAGAVVPEALAANTGSVSITVSGLRNTKGYLRACITANARTFPNCDRDPNAQKVSVDARNGTVLNFTGLPAGRYAIAVIHDENGDGKMNKTLMLPKEGFGFSRDAPVRMGPPSFGSAAFDLGSGHINSAIRIRYL
jgi:uncharacterized protein (DUF2141 family)